MERFGIEGERLWKSLLLLGLLLNVLVCFTSDLGLDTQVKMAVNDDGALPWGDLRPETTGQSDASDGGERRVLPLYGLSETGIKATALVTFLGLLACLYRWSGVRSATIFSLSPAMLFSVGRGYEEVYLAVFCSVALLLFSGVLSGKYRALQCFFGGICFMAMVYSKGFTTLLGVLLGALFIAAVVLMWHELQQRQWKGTAWMARPDVVAIVSGSVVALVMFVFGLLEMNPTLAIIGQEPLRYVSALLFSVFDLGVLYVLFGMVVWPFVPPVLKGIKESRDERVAFIAGYISGIFVALVLYVAALWTYEASIWGAEWPGIIWTMGNNGRYVTMLYIPLVILMHQMSKLHSIPTLDDPKSKLKPMFATILLLLPLSLLASVHGQTMWTDEAAEAMELETNDHFLFVSEDTLGMHWLYTFYAPLDAEQNNITGHWRSISSQWESDLNSTLSHVQVIVTSPDATLTPLGWDVKHSGESDFLNGKGEWRVLTRS